MSRYYVKIPEKYPHRSTFIQKYAEWEDANNHSKFGVVVIVNGQGRILNSKAVDEGRLDDPPARPTQPASE